MTRKNNVNNQFNNSKKLNAGCLKIFEFIKLLYADEAYYDRVTEIFKDEISSQDNGSNNLQVILNKYVNTLKVFGIKIIKEKQKYKLLSSFYEMKFTMEDLKAISILLSSVENFPDQKLSDNIKNFVNNMEIRMKNEDRNTLSSLTRNNGYDFSFYYSNQKEQIKQCIDICNQGSLIRILYLDKKQEKTVTCTAKEVLYDSKLVSLRVYVYDATESQNMDIPIVNILSIAILPNAKSSKEITQTIVFKLKGRLARTYKIRSHENVLEDNKKSDELVIANHGEPFDELLSRLMRYSTSCEIISPKSFKDKMLELINETLYNYD